jgi:hypothetical protein
MFMLRDLLVGSIIILAPLGILILIIATDLDSKEQELSQRIKKLNRTADGLIEKNPKNLNGVLSGFELDKQDKEHVDKLANGTGFKNNEKNDSANDLIEDYALVVKNVATMRSKERLLLSTKIKSFKIYAAVMYILVWLSLGILPLLYYMGFNWGWK